MARLAGVEPAARGFEGRTHHRPRASRNVPPYVIPHGYADATGRAGTNRTSGDAHLCHARATALPGCVPTTHGEKERRERRAAAPSCSAGAVPQSAPGGRTSRRVPRDDLPADRTW